MFLSNLVYFFYRILYGLWRIKIYEADAVKALLKEQKPFILAHWHGDEYSLLHLVRRYSLATMTSTSRDGAIVDHVIHRLGGQTTRGSSTRGGVGALIGLVRLLRSGHRTSVAVDGPRGPIYKPKPGIFELSKLCGASIVPIGIQASRSWHFKKAWNKAFLPMPFATVVIVLTAPLKPLTEDMDPKDVRLGDLLATELMAARQQASQIIATM